MLLARARRRAAAVRLRRDRAAGAPRAAPLRAHRDGSTRRRSRRASSVVAYSEHEAECPATLAARARRRRARRVRPVRRRHRCVPAGRRVSRRSTSSPSERTRTATSSCCSPSRARCPDVRFLVVASAEHARSLGERPPNVSVETDLPFDEMRDRLERARVVALPVRDNSYSGATTVLLQAMALAKPVVVTRTAAIATGYGLVDGENVPARRARRRRRRSRRRVAEVLARRGARDERSARTRGATVERASRGIATSASSRISSRRPPALRLPLRLGPAAAPPGASSPPARGRMPRGAGPARRLRTLPRDASRRRPRRRPARPSAGVPRIVGHSSPSMLTLTIVRAPARSRPPRARTSASASTRTRSTPTSCSAHASGGWSACPQEAPITWSSASPALRADGGPAPSARCAAPRSRAAAALEERDVRRLGLVRDDRCVRRGEGVRAVVALVRAEVDDARVRGSRPRTRSSTATNAKDAQSIS